MSQKIVPNIWCNRNAEDVGAFYASVFPGASSEVEARYPDTGLLDFQQDFAGAPLTVGLRVPDPRGEHPFRFTLINAGDEFRPNPSISFMLNFDPLFFGAQGGEADAQAARAAIDRLWGLLAEGGAPLMPLDEYPFSPYYGWVRDRYGVNWQLMLTDAGGDPRPFVIPALMFDGPAQNRAAEAAELYVDLFAHAPGGAEVGHRAPYGAPTGHASAEALAFGEFRIGEQWFMAADNGSGVDHGFTCGVSLEVRCEDQTEIDRLWKGLSAVPEAEQCGWCRDVFGVNWQVVPENLDELMARPDAYGRMMGMKKIVIADF